MTVLLACAVLPCPPIAMLVCHVHARHADERAAAEAFHVAHEFRGLTKELKR